MSLLLLQGPYFLSYSCVSIIIFPCIIRDSFDMYKLHNYNIVTSYLILSWPLLPVYFMAYGMFSFSVPTHVSIFINISESRSLTLCLKTTGAVDRVNQFLDACNAIVLVVCCAVDACLIKMPLLPKHLPCFRTAFSVPIRKTTVTANSTCWQGISGGGFSKISFSKSKFLQWTTFRNV